MCFVCNHGLIQIHSGSIKKLLRTGQWFKVLEPHFNLHLDTTVIDSTWIVNKPTSEGWVTSIECYTKDGEMIAQFFRSEEHTSELQSLMRISYAVFCLKKKIIKQIDKS